MATVFVRTAIIYFIFFFSVRIVGKRQIGELQLSEFITTLMMSELAVNSIQDISIPVSYSFIPVIFLLCIEIIISFLSTKSQWLKNLLFGSPSIIIKNGKIDQKQLAKLRMSVNELLSELRLKDISSVDEVDYAVIEQNGKLSVFPKPKKQNVTREDMKIKADGDTLTFSLITDGEISRNDLYYVGKDEAWLKDYLKKRNIEIKDVFLLTMGKSGRVSIVFKEEK